MEGKGYTVMSLVVSPLQPRLLTAWRLIWCTPVSGKWTATSCKAEVLPPPKSHFQVMAVSGGTSRLPLKLSDESLQIPGVLLITGSGVANTRTVSVKVCEQPAT